MTTYIVSAGQSSGGFALNSGDVMSVLSGGSAVDVTVSAGGDLFISGGGSAIDTVVTGTADFTGQGSVTVLSGGMTTGTVIGGGNDFGPPEGVEFVFSGGTALATVMSTGATLFISGGATASGITASNGATIFVGGTASSVTLENSAESVLSGGVDVSATIEFAGQQQVLGSAFGATVAVSGDQAVAAGGTATDTVVNGGNQTILAGGTAVGTMLTGGTELVSGTASGLTLGGGAVETVIDGGLTFSTTVNSGGIESIASGGTANFTTVNSGGTENLYFSGTANDTTSNTGAFVYSAINAFVSAGVTSSGLSLSATGVLVVLSGGTMIDLTVNSGGTEYVSAGGIASGTTIIGDGVGNIWGTDVGAVLVGTPPPPHSDEPGEADEFVMSGGVIIGATLSGGSQITISSGGVASNTLADGTINPAVGQGDQLLVLPGGVTFSTRLITGGEEQLDGAVGTDELVSAGGELLLENAASAFFATLSSGGTAQVYGGVAISTTVSGGGALNIGAGFTSGSVGSSFGAMLLSGATETITGGIAIDTVVHSGATLSAAFGLGEGFDNFSIGFTSDTIVQSGGTLVVGLIAHSVNDVAERGAIVVGSDGQISGMALSGTLSMMVTEGTDITVFSGGTISATDLSSTVATTILSGATEFVFLSATALSSLISGGTQSISSGGIASGGIVEDGGSEVVLSGGSATHATVSAGGFEVVSSGGIAISATVSTGGVELVSSGGTASGTIVRDGGSEVLLFGGAAGFTTISNGGTEVVSSGAAAISTTVSVGGAIDLPNLAFAGGGSATVTSGGFLTVSAGGQTYTQQLAGSYAGDTFELSADSGSGTMITLEETPLIAPAVADVLNGGSINFGNVRVGAAASETLDISNAATGTAAALDASVQSVSGAATANGSFTGLAPGAENTTSITAGINTGTAGVQTGTVALAFVSDGGTLGSTGLPARDVTVVGTVYREAAAELTPVNEVVHVGDPGTVAVTVSNTAAADGFSENLLASLAGVTGGLSIAAAGPTGEIAAAGSDASSLQLGFVTTSAGNISGAATIDLTSDGGIGSASIDGLGSTVIGTVSVPVSVTVDNFANPVFEDVSGTGKFTPGVTAYTLNLGTIAEGTGPLVVDLGVLNNTTGPSDVATGSLSAIGSSAFTNSGLASIGTLAAGQSDIAPEITLATGTTGTFSETITLTGTGSNPDFSAALPAETLTVTGSIAALLIPPADPDILNGGSINFANVHVGAAASETLDISNAATGTAAALDASVGSVSGAATASGSFAGLAPGAENTTNITAGINTGTAGIQTGTVALAFVSDGGTLGSAALPAQDVTLSGTVYREAAAALLPLNAIVHVGDPGTISLPISNGDPADGFSENLIAMLIGTTGSLGIATAGPTADIAAGETNTNTLALSFATTQAGTISGSAMVGLTSDGAGIDGLGQTTLAAQTVPVTITVDNLATVALSSDGSLISTGPDSYVLNLGTATQGAAALSADLNLGNTATGPADFLDGSFNATGSGQFNNAGLGSVSTITAGTSADAGNVTLSTTQTGVFSETIMLSPTDANADGFSDALTARSITVTGTIVPSTGTSEGDVHMVTYDGLHYDFQAVGDYVLTRSTVPGDTFQIQIETAADPSIAAVSITTEVAARVGSDVVTFGFGQVSVDGAPDTALSATDPLQELAGGQLQELSPTEFRLTWASGEVLTVTNAGSYLNTTVSLPKTDGPGSVQGLLGANSGLANDFQLANGTVLRQPLSTETILGTFANAWSVAADASMLNGAIIANPDQPAFLAVTTPGEILTGSLGAALSGATYAGTMADLAGDTLFGFAAGDAVDITDFAPAGATLNVTGSDTNGVLTMNGTGGAKSFQVEAAANGVGFSLTADGRGGSLIRAT